MVEIYIYIYIYNPKKLCQYKTKCFVQDNFMTYLKDLTNRIFVFISVHTSINYIAEEVIQDMSQAFGIHHPVQGSDEHRLGGFQALTRLFNEVTVAQHPWNHLNLKIRKGNHQFMINCSSLIIGPSKTFPMSSSILTPFFCLPSLLLIFCLV